MAVAYLGVLGIAEALGVSRHAVHKWRSRYPAGSAHPFPEPDVEVEGTPGWSARRLEEIMEWHEGLPGRGVGGGRPSAARQEYFEEAANRGLEGDEPARVLAAFGQEYPEMSEAEICEWLVKEWRS